MQQVATSQEAQPALTRTSIAAAPQPLADANGSQPGALSLSRSGSEPVDFAVAVIAEACRGGQPLPGCRQPGAGCSLQAAASAEAQALAGGNAAGLAAVLSAHRQVAAGCDSAGSSASQAYSDACEVQHSLRACSGALGSAAKSACEASTKANPTGSLAWQIAVLDVMPLGPTALDYKFTARGQLPEVWPSSLQAAQSPRCARCFSKALTSKWRTAFIPRVCEFPKSIVHVSASWLTLTCGMIVQGVQQSKLATAFGPEHAEDEGEDASGMSARVQIGDALVALLESHRSHR